jgi:hypothetical protein
MHSYTIPIEWEYRQQDVEWARKYDTTVYDVSINVLKRVSKMMCECGEIKDL